MNLLMNGNCSLCIAQLDSFRSDFTNRCLIFDQSLQNFKRWKLKINNILLK
jgi:hypothetical protein